MKLLQFFAFLFTLIVLHLLPSVEASDGSGRGRCAAILIASDIRESRIARRGTIAVMVNTPHLSPVKIQLAEDVGADAAESFYLGSILTTEEVVKGAVAQMRSSGLILKPYWAIAEVEGLRESLWKNFEGLYQGEGEMGQRVFNVYSDLLSRSAYGILIGADAPHIPVRLISEAALALQNTTKPKFVMGPSSNGSFYLLSGNRPIPEEVLNRVTFGQLDTASVLANELRKLGEVVELELLSNIESIEDLQNVDEYWSGHHDLIKPQRVMMRQMRSLLKFHEEILDYTDL